MAQAKAFVDVEETEDPQPMSVQAGRIRHVAQDPARAHFCTAYWANEEYDLTEKYGPSGRKYGYYAGNMCTRAAYSEALSYLGVDITPVGMSSLLGSRNLDAPYDAVTEAIPGLTRTEENGHGDLWNMINRYLTDSSYSPVMVVLKYPNKATFHTLLVIGVNKNGRAIMLDSAYHPTKGKATYVFTMKLAANGSCVRSSDVYAYRGMTVRAVYQWHYQGSEPGPAVGSDL